MADEEEGEEEGEEEEEKRLVDLRRSSLMASPQVKISTICGQFCYGTSFMEAPQALYMYVHVSAD